MKQKTCPHTRPGASGAGPLGAGGMDYEMAETFLEGNRADGAAGYRDRLASAGQSADPEPRNRLANLDLALSRRPPEN